MATVRPDAATIEEIRKTQQVVIQAKAAGDESIVKWAIGRESKRR